MEMESKWMDSTVEIGMLEEIRNSMSSPRRKHVRLVGSQHVRL